MNKLLLILFLAFFIVSCEKEENQSTSRVTGSANLNPNTKGLKGKELLMAKNWEYYRQSIDGSNFDFRTPANYRFFSDSVLWVNGNSNQKWYVNNDTMVNRIYIDQQEWRVLSLEQSNMVWEMPGPISLRMYFR